VRARTFAWLVFLGFLFFALPSARAQDMREASRKAALERSTARDEAREAEERILKDRKVLRVEVDKLEARQQALESDIRALEESIAENRDEEARLSATWAEKELAFREIVGSVRISARDLETIFLHSPFTALAPERTEKLRPLLDKKYFPGIEDIRLLADLYLDEAGRSGEVSLRDGSFVDRTGTDRTGKILSLGKFTAVYDDGEETGFLSYSEDGKRLRALSALPSWMTRRNLDRYVD